MDEGCKKYLKTLAMLIAKIKASVGYYESIGPILGGTSNFENNHGECYGLVNEINEKIKEIKFITGPYKSIDPIVDNINDFKDSYGKCYSQIDELIDKINNEFPLSLEHLNFWSSTDDILLRNTSYEELKNHLEKVYNPLERTISAYLSGADDSFWKIIHPDIIKISKNKFDDGHYANAVEDAFKEINVRVKEIYKTHRNEEKDGPKLMNKAFGYKPNGVLPCIQVDDDLYSMAGRDRQEGYRAIFSGSIQAIRNPKAHINFAILKEDAMHSICLASQLMYVLDNSKVN